MTPGDVAIVQTVLAVFATVAIMLLVIGPFDRLMERLMKRK
jgi:preprotein translocase subunit SecE